MITPDRCLIFPSVDYVRNLVTKHSIKQSLPVVIDCTVSLWHFLQSNLFN